MEKYKVLVVDDEPDNLALLYRTLRLDYDVVKASSPIDALEILKTQKFALILSDHKMPVMDGVEFLKRAQELQPDTVRLLITAYSDAKILIDAINEAKIYRYVKKPYQPSELLHVVDLSAEYYQLKLDNKSLIVDLKELFAGAIKSITSALDARDSFTSGRSRRVTYYSLKVAEELKLSKEEIGKIEIASLLHDIGVIGVVDDILHKTDSLTDEEYEEIKKHVFHSVKILEDIKQLEDVTTIIKFHHEHFDGNGYPTGIKGEEIPLGSRIIAIADAFESLVTDRANRKKVLPEVAIQIIEEQKGKQFDPVLVDVFKNIIFKAIKEIENESLEEFSEI